MSRQLTHDLLLECMLALGGPVSVLELVDILRDIWSVPGPTVSAITALLKATPSTFTITIVLANYSKEVFWVPSIISNLVWAQWCRP